MHDHKLQLYDIIDRNSTVLLGPRQTGKSTYLRQRFPEARYVDLLEADTFRELSSFPETLRQSLLPSDKLIVIDEIRDTLIAHIRAPYQKTTKRKAVATEKFYFFDTGVARSLARARDIQQATPAFGKALEHLIYLELLAYRDYTQKDVALYYWRSQSPFEFEFVINDSIAIEVKASARVANQDMKGLKALAEEPADWIKTLICLQPYI